MRSSSRRGPCTQPVPPRHRRLQTYAALLLGLALGWALPATAADNPGTAPDVIGSIHDIYTVPAAEAGRAHQFRWDLDILYSDPEWHLLWLENNGFATFIPTAKDFPLFATGQRVRAEGELIPAQGPSLDNARLTVLPEPSSITPLPTAGQLADATRFTNRLVTLEAVVDRQSEPDATHLMLEASAEGLHVVVRVRVPRKTDRPQLEGAIIRATGVYVGQHNSSGDLTSVALWVSDLAAVQVRGTLQDSPDFAVPVVRIDEATTHYNGRPVHLAGIVHAFDNTAATITLRDATGQIVVSTAQTRDIRVGQELEAVGTPEVAGVQHRLLNAMVRPVATLRSPAAAGLAEGRLRLADQVLALKPDEADRGHPVQLVGVATWMAPDRASMFVQDMTGGIEVRLPALAQLPPALPCTVRIDGRAGRGSYAPLVEATAVVWSNPIGSPTPPTTTLEEMLTGSRHGRWVGIQAYLRGTRPDPRALQLDLTTSTGEFTAWLPPDATLMAAPGSIIRLRGVCCVVANDRHQLTSVRLLVPDARYVAVEQKAPADPFALPVRTIAGLREFGPGESALGRVCTRGTVVFHEPGRHLCLQDGNDTLLALSGDPTPLLPGDQVELVGLPGREGCRLVLREAIFRCTGKGDEPTPTDLPRPEVPDAALDGRLVRVTGTITGIQRQPAETIVTVQAGKRLFEAALAGNRPPAGLLDEGSEVSLQGVYRVVYDEARQPIDFTLRLRSRHDIAVLRAPPLWTVPRALAAAGGLLLVTAAILGWLAVLRSRVAKQTRQIRAQLEHQSRLEAELQRAQRIESLGLLAGGLAHDFNNLLTGILGNLGLARLDETAAATVGAIHSEAEYAALRARDLTPRLLVFTRGAPAARAVIRLAPLVRESATFALHGSGTRCEFEIATDLWPADADRVQIGQVVQNLAINAMQAMPTGGTLRLTLENAPVASGRVADLAPGRYVLLTATDTGQGIPAEYLPRIFDPYFTTKGTGTGLGLATVYSIVRQHGGHVGVESTPGVGTTFRIWLPAAAADQVPEEASPGQVPPAGEPVAPAAARILIMDDDPSIRRIASLALLHAGYEVTATADGREAVEEHVTAQKRGRPYALVLLDLTIPGGMGGREAMAAIRNFTPAIRAIVTTGHGQDPVFAAYRDHGFDAALAKPYEVKELTALVAATLAPRP